MARFVDWTNPAKSDLRKLQKRDADRVRRAVDRLADSGHGNIVQLHGFRPPVYRLRVGDWRALIKITKAAVEVERVLHRREAYRKSSLPRQDMPAEEGLQPGGSWESVDCARERDEESQQIEQCEPRQTDEVEAREFR